ncbi:MAG: hypothetical protein NTV79_01865 [Candidatus Aureabacteria bacterium]|nr:hypothetical protein [Candidatus Auribacterota bacterium]
MVLLLWLFFSFLGAWIGGRKNQAGTGFLLGLLFGPIGLLIICLTQGNRLKCPMCRKMIENDARLCPYCRSDLAIGPGSSDAYYYRSDAPPARTERMTRALR